MTVKHCVLAAALATALVATAWAADSEGIEITRFLPKFDTEQSVERIQKGLAPMKELESALKASTDKVWKYVEEYRETPSSELQGKIYNAVAESGEIIVGHITTLDGQRDRLRDELRKINTNIGEMLHNIGTYPGSLKGRLGDVVEQARVDKKELAELARYLVDNPDDTERRQAFRRKLVAFKQLQYKARLFQQNRAFYAKVAQQIGQVHEFFTRFEGHIDTALDSLALQKQGITMQLACLRDKAKLVAWLGNGQGNSIAALMKQLSGVMANIGGFQKVMATATDIGDGLEDFTEKFPLPDELALPGDIGEGGKSLDKIISSFANVE